MLAQPLCWRTSWGLGKLPIESHKLQAFVSEPIKPFLDTVVVYGAGHGHFYISQSDKGGMVFGGDLDGYNSYAQKGNLPIYTDVAGCAMNVMPALGRGEAVASMGRHYGYVNGWLALYHQNRCSEFLSECGLVLWRV